MKLWSGLVSNFCIVCVTRSGSYYPMEYICRTFDLAEGNEWFGRNKEADLSKPFELKQKRLPIDFNVNEDLLHDKDIQDRLRHLHNFPVPYCVKAMPPQFTNTVESVNIPVLEKIKFAQKILRDFDLIYFINEDKVSHFCYEITSKLCSSKDYPRPREYSTYDPDLRVTPPPNSFTATLQDFYTFKTRDIFTEKVMEVFECPVITYKDFVKDQDKEMKKIADYYDITPKKVDKIPIVLNPDYSNIFTNYKEICKWFTTY